MLISGTESRHPAAVFRGQIFKGKLRIPRTIWKEAVDATVGDSNGKAAGVFEVKVPYEE
jgi:hypothetical protein